MSERIKYLAYQQINCSRFFWRTHAQQEIDYVEERNGQMKAYEIKWNPKSKARFPRAFLEAYPGTETSIITPENINNFLL